MLVLLVFLVSIVPMTLADEEGDSETDTAGEDIDATGEVNEEVEVMADPLGAEIRLLQLERAITRRVMWGAEIVDYIGEKDAEADVSELNGILDELELLTEEIQGVSREGTVDDMTQEFIDIKNDAQELVKEFKELLPSFLDESDRAALREKIKTMDRQVIRDLTKEILKTKRQYIAARAERVLENMGVEDSDLVNKVESGELTLQQAKTRIVTKLRALTPVQKKAVVAKVKENIAVRKDFMNEIKVKSAAIGSKIAERKSDRLQKRSELAEVAGLEGRAQRLETKSKIVERASNKLALRSAKLRGQ